MSETAEPQDANAIWGDDEKEELESQINQFTTDQLKTRTRMLQDNAMVMRGESSRVLFEIRSLSTQVKSAVDKVKIHKQLPYLVANVVEVLSLPNDVEEDGAAADALASVGKSVVIKTSARQTVYLPVTGLVEADSLKPGDLVGVNKDSFLILDTLPAEYDSRVKTMEVEEKPTEDYVDIGGLDKQIEELKEAIVYPMIHQHLYKSIGIRPPKGVLLFGPPGTGKTMIARACAAKTNACFLKISAPQLVQMYIGDGAKMVRDAFELAREKAPSVIFIDEIDAIGTKRFDSDKSGDREVQRTMLELLNQLDGFSSDERVKIIAATNRPDILDPALLRSGRLDRKVEFPLPDEDGRGKIMRIHSAKMLVDTASVNFQELARATEDFNGAQLKAVCVEAGMIALRRGATIIGHEDFVSGIQEVAAKKKVNLQYYA